MKILYLSELWFHDLWFLRHLNGSGHEVLSVRAFRSPWSLDAAELLAPFPRIRHLETPHWFGEARAEGRIPELGIARRLKKLVAEFRPDVLQCGWLSDGGVISALTGFHPLLMTPFGSDVLINPYGSPEHRWKATLALRCADAITTDSVEVAHRITQLSGFPLARIVRFPWGIDLTRFGPDVPRTGFRARLGWEGRCVLVATRTLEPLYGTRFLLDAMPAVLRARPEAALLLIGDGPERPALEAQASRLGISGSVHFQGRVPNADLHGWLAECDAYVTATLSDGTSRSMMEAMASGLPVAVTAVPAVREWVQEGVQGALARPRDAEDLSLAILRVLGGDRDAMRAACLALAREHFDERRNLGKLEGMYRDLAAGIRRPERENGGDLPPLDLEDYFVPPVRWPSWRARAAEWGVIAALWRASRRA